MVAAIARFANFARQAGAMALLAAVGLLCGAKATGQTVESALSPGPISTPHLKYEHECNSCHVRFQPSGQDKLCSDCHKEVGQDIRERTGYHGRKENPGQACRSCHTEHRGRAAKIAPLDTKAFDHKLTDYLLQDKHQGVDCNKCHLPGKRWREAAHDCHACHVKDDTHKGGLGKKCEDCHKPTGWKEVEFDHGKKTRFTLLDKHGTAKCDACHANGRFKDTPRNCIGCHRKEDETKGHKGQYGEKCEACHSAKDWKPSTFSHDIHTKYALKDKHRAVKCASCHTGHLYKVKLATACVDCHAKDDKHEGSLGKKCESCHVEKGWRDSPNFDHSKTTFPLLGAHAKVQCKDCHPTQRYKPTPGLCIDCHRKDDKHKGTLGATCGDCHGEKAWKPILPKFDHSKTKFPLRGAHGSAKVECKACHDALDRFRGIATDCFSCHRKDDKHQGTLDKSCDGCHSEANWRVERFDHRRTKFALTGRHQLVACKSCHSSILFRSTPKDCLSCHRKDDTHKSTLGDRCESCHSDRGWSLWTFDHDKTTRFALLGKHSQVRCADCHKTPAPKGKAVGPVGTLCDSCHRKDDVHEGRYGRRCDLCHNPQSWAQIKRP